jgi:acetyl esterase/lipase
MFVLHRSEAYGETRGQPRLANENPLASPLYGDLSGLPPIRVHVGGDELLLDDSRR